MCASLCWAIKQNLVIVFNQNTSTIPALQSNRKLSWFLTFKRCWHWESTLAFDHHRKLNWRCGNRYKSLIFVKISRVSLCFWIKIQHNLVIVCVGHRKACNRTTVSINRIGLRATIFRRHHNWNRLFLARRNIVNTITTYISYIAISNRINRDAIHIGIKISFIESFACTKARDQSAVA